MHAWRGMLHREPCVYCGKSPDIENPEQRTIDHIVAKRKGGTNDWSNKAPSCQTCNLYKGTRSMLLVVAIRCRRGSPLQWRLRKGLFRGAVSKGSSWIHWRREQKWQ